MTSAPRVESLLARSAEMFIVGSALLNLLGWSLALAHQLKPVPYAIGFAVTIGVLVVLNRRRATRVRNPNEEFHRGKRRLRRPIVTVFFLIWLAALVGGSLYAPSNYDGLSYRTPQLLHWLSENGWHWITTPNSRMNIASPGFNWLVAPTIVILKTDRLSFLMNVAGFALLPGLLFEMLRRAGVATIVAWWWMWLLPAAYVFAMQAGGIGNDLTGTVFGVSAVAFALRARQTGAFSDASLSLLAAAMCTGIKNTNLPILLPWIVALGAGGLRAFCAKPAKSMVVALLAAFASCAPTTLLNIRHTGHWSGDLHDEHRVRQPNAWVGAASNLTVLAVSNLQPPIWPIAQRSNEVLNRILIATGMSKVCKKSPRFDAKWYELPSEESAGVGLGLVVMSGISVTGAFLHRLRGNHSEFIPKRWDVGLASLAAILVPVCLMSSEGLPRMIAVFVPPVLILALIGAVNQRLVRSSAWRRGAVVAACFSVPGIVLSAPRPLFPQRVLFASVGKESGVMARARRVYSIYANRPDAFAPLRTLIPAGTRKIGLIAFGDEPETSIWRPFGSVSVRHLLADQNLDPDLVIVASDPVCRTRFGQGAPAFASAHGLTIAGSAEIELRASGTPERWYVLVPEPD